jgi:dTDP-4-dehydrorhamnose reductase
MEKIETKKKILILGANGMAGHIITLHFREKGKFETYALARKDSTIKPDIFLDVTNFNLLYEKIYEIKPDIVINAVGLLNSEAENNPEEAILINSYLPHYLEKITKNTQIKIIHISTDCVFSGKIGGYLEDDFKDGIGFYAQSKGLGELINSKDLTLRTSIIGPELNNSGIGLFNWFLNQAGVVKGFTKAIWTGVTTIELAKAIESSIDQNLNGLHHLVNNKTISKYQLLKDIQTIFNRNNIEIIPDDFYRVDKSLVNSKMEFKYNIPSYFDMFLEMKKWMDKNAFLYNY